jgi:hypothetical protein
MRKEVQMRKAVALMTTICTVILLCSCSKYTVGPKTEEKDDMKTPYDTEMTGSHGDYFFIPIDGKIFRYGYFSAWEEKLTKTELIYEFNEEEFDRIYEYKIYRLAEYPNDTVLYCLTDEKVTDPTDGPGFHDESLIRYMPNTKAGENELEITMESGFVVMKNGSVTHGKDAWMDFIQKTQAGESASIRTCRYYTLSKKGTSADYYESVKEDYPALYLNELKYDGTQYVLSPLHREGDEYIVYEQVGYDNPTSSWKYLVHFTGEPDSPTALFTYYDKYVLLNDETVTWEQLLRGLYSSTFGNHIPFEEVYCEYTWK